MDKAPELARPAALRPPKYDVSAAQVRMLVVLVLCFAILPGAVLLFVGILVLVFGSQARDYVFGTLILSLTVTFIAGITATVLYVRRGTSLARLQTEFVQKVSHDLRTPLTSIRMFVETLQSGRLADPAKVQECLEVIAAETARLEDLVERLLRWATMEAGKRAYHSSRVVVAEVVDRALAALDPQVKALRLEGNLVELTHEVAPDLPIIDADPLALSEALVHVLENALRYAGTSKKIRVSCSRGERELVLSVSDNGPGIAKHEQRRIFEKFYRAVDPANINVKGTGLGLAMVHHIVSAHRGRVEVESDLGHGATFHLFLPLPTEES